MINFLENKKLFIINIVLAVVIIAMDICLICVGEPYIFKVLASVFFVVMGAVNFAFILMEKSERKPLFKYLMLVGLIFACLGDIILISNFVVGAVLFAIGHIFFFAGYSVLVKPKWRDLIISLILFAIALIVILVPQIYDFRGMMAVVIVYALIICFMLGKAISNVFGKEYRAENILIMIGSLLFFLSDMMLLFNNFTDFSNVFGILCLVLYYPAEIILAGSIYYSNKKIDYSKSAVMESGNK